MTAASELDSVSTRLDGVIRAAMAEAGGWLPFDRFMALALYAPGLGYYANAGRKFGILPGSGSDFVTAPEMSPLFGQALAAQVAQALQASGTETVIEFGAGSGRLAAQLLDALGAHVSGYHIVELSAELRERQRAELQRFGDRVRWLDELPDAIDGVVVANEVLDAMPVQLLHFDGEHWRERGVAADGHRWTWSDRPTSMRPPLDGPFVPGTVTELHLQAQAWTATVAQRLRRGMVLLIDYGFPEAEYYHPQRHGGTLMCHRAHRADPDPLADVGCKDITAHVDFTAIALSAQNAGCAVVGYTSQARFLVNCGLGVLIERAGVAERVMAHKLIAEHEMGELFKVLAFVRGCGVDPLGFAAGDRSHRL